MFESWSRVADPADGTDDADGISGQSFKPNHPSASPTFTIEENIDA